jgi:hypothetical protein
MKLYKEIRIFVVFGNSNNSETKEPSSQEYSHHTAERNKQGSVVWFIYLDHTPFQTRDSVMRPVHIHAHPPVRNCRACSQIIICTTLFREKEAAYQGKSQNSGLQNLLDTKNHKSYVRSL